MAAPSDTVNDNSPFKRQKMGENLVTVVLGAQWGDEGKGKIVDLLCQDMDVVCRCQASTGILFPAAWSVIHCHICVITTGFLNYYFMLIRVAITLVTRLLSRESSTTSICYLVELLIHSANL